MYICDPGNVDDVISTGESLKAMESLVEKAGGKVAGTPYMPTRRPASAILARIVGRRRCVAFTKRTP